MECVIGLLICFEIALAKGKPCYAGKLVYGQRSWITLPVFRTREVLCFQNPPPYAWIIPLILLNNSLIGVNRPIMEKTEHYLLKFLACFKRLARSLKPVKLNVFWL